MNYFTFRTKGLVAFIALLGLSILMSINVQSQVQRSDKTYYDKEASEKVPGAKYVREGESIKYPGYVKMAEETRVSAEAFDTWLTKSLKMDDNVEFNLTKQQSDDLGMVHQRYQQTYKGIPVDRAEYVVHIKNDNVASFSGDAFKVPEMSVEAALTPEGALKIALEYISAEKYYWESDFWENRIKEKEDDASATWYPEAQLIITSFGNNTREEFKLAYQFDIYAYQPDIAKRVFVDANSGEILYTLLLASDCEDPVNFSSVFNGTQSVRTDKYTSDLYRLRDDCQTAVIHIWDWGSDTSNYDNTVIEEIDNNDNVWSSQDERFGASVLWATKESYLYFLNTHGRSSYDDANGGVNGFINAVFSSSGGDYVDNASMSFTGGFMKVGEGADPGLADSWGTVDIIGHEYTHAVTGSSSQLVYQGEPGALNESFSDIFGEMIENMTEGSNDWLMGDDRSDGYIRNMSNPKDKNDPDTYNGTNWRNTCNTCSDNGGVHTNSGVMNYWFYLVAIGGSGTNDNGDSYSVTGIGRTKASAIAFRNMVLKLTTNSDYADARDGAIEAAEDLYGACSNEVVQVINAWHAVGVGEPFVDVTADAPDKPGGYDISCNGGSDGTINLDLTGTAPFTIAWDHGPTSATLNGLSAGTYGVTVTDATGCSASTSITLTEPPVLTASAAVTSDYNGYGVSCNGGSDGVVEVTPGGGAPPYSYLWDDPNGQTTAEATGLMAGTYNVTVTDANGCTETSFATLTEPTPILVEAGDNQTVYYGYEPAECADLMWSGVSGGVPPYSIEWSTSETTQSITVCPDSTQYYYVIVTDDNNCVAMDSVKVCVIDVRCGNGLTKIEICHFPPDNPDNSETLCVGYNSVEEHLSHGDSLAACGTVHACTDAKSVIASMEKNDGDYNLTAFPNPFSSTTTIRFYTAMEGEYSLRLMNYSGVTVSEIFHARAEAGKWYQFTVSGSVLVPGMYFAVLQKPDQSVEIVKVILNR